MEVTGDQDETRAFAGAVEDFKEDVFRIVETSFGSIGVVRRPNGFFAVMNRCPHMGAPLCLGGKATRTTAPSKPFEYSTDEEHSVVRCPWHRWEYDIETGRNVGNITRTRIVTYPVVVEDGKVFVTRPVRAARRAEGNAEKASQA